MKHQFSFVSLYLNVIEYDCRDETGCYRLQFRVGVSDYEKSIYNGTAEQYAADCAAVVGWLTASWPRIISPETVAAFNIWQQEKTAASLAKMDAAPEKYGLISADDPIRNPLQAKGAAHWDGKWRFEALSLSVAA